MDLEWAVAEGGDEEEWECVVCNKTFRSEAAWDSHERSKKHLKEVERLQRQMQEEDEALGLEAEDPGLPEDEAVEEEIKITAKENVAVVDDASEPPLSPSPSSKSNIDNPEISEGVSELPTRDVSPQPEHRKTKKRDKKNGLEPMSKTERRALRRNQQVDSDEDGPVLDGGDQPKEGEASVQMPELSKRDKRRARQAKKAESAATANKEACLIPRYRWKPAHNGSN